MDKSLGELKKALINVVPLHIIDYSKIFHMYTNASKYAVGAVLQKMDLHGKWRPIALHSRKFLGRK